MDIAYRLGRCRKLLEEIGRLDVYSLRCSIFVGWQANHSPIYSDIGRRRIMPDSVAEPDTGDP